MILVIDNYDSFAYNLVQYVAEAQATAASGNRGADGGDDGDDDDGAACADADRADDSDAFDDGADVVVRRNDEIDVAGIRELDPDGIVVSPGPGTPAEAGVSIPIFEETEYPALGVCLGHQALCAAHGAPVGRAPEVVHGKPSVVSHDGRGIFAGLPGEFAVGRYHSLAVEREALPEPLVETARTEDEQAILMGVRHRELPHVGVQFHPESILTGRADREAAGGALSLELGKRLVANFCTYAREVAEDDRR